MSYIYPIDTLMKWNGNRITEHNRKELSVSSEKLMNENRMVDGTLRRYVVAEKRRWQLTWDEVFSNQASVVDGCWSGEEMLQFFKAHRGEFTLELTHKSASDSAKTSTEIVTVMFDEFSHRVIKRSIQCDWWSIDVTLVEV